MQADPAMDSSLDRPTETVSVEELVTEGVGMSEEPAEKKRRTEVSAMDLQSRLLGVLSCSVCFDLPKRSVYQCQNGHLMCCSCFHHLLADARLKNEQPSCPSCRVDISQRLCIRNLAVEKAISELPGECKYCCKLLPRNEICYHEMSTCEEREISCPYILIGCNWNGKSRESKQHVASCEMRLKQGEDILENVEHQFEASKQEVSRMGNIVRLLSYERVAICDVQLTACRTDDFAQKLYHESNRFSAFENNWTVNTQVMGDSRSNNRKLSYQLCFHGKAVVDVKYFAAKGPFGEVDIKPDVQRFEFKDDERESEYHPIMLHSPEDCNILLSARTINVRLLMFQIKK